MQQLAADSDERDRMVAFEMRAELDVRSRELVSHMNRVAVLEGQVSCDVITSKSVFLLCEILDHVLGVSSVLSGLQVDD